MCELMVHWVGEAKLHQFCSPWKLVMWQASQLAGFIFSSLKKKVRSGGLGEDYSARLESAPLES